MREKQLVPSEAFTGRYFCLLFYFDIFCRKELGHSAEGGREGEEERGEGRGEKGKREGGAGGQGRGGGERGFGE